MTSLCSCSNTRDERSWSPYPYLSADSSSCSKKRHVLLLKPTECILLWPQGGPHLLRPFQAVHGLPSSLGSLCCFEDHICLVSHRRHPKVLHLTCKYVGASPHLQSCQHMREDILRRQDYKHAYLHKVAGLPEVTPKEHMAALEEGRETVAHRAVGRGPWHQEA